MQLYKLLSIKGNTLNVRTVQLLSQPAHSFLRGMPCWTACKHKMTAAAEKVQGPLCQVKRWWDHQMVKKMRLDFNREGIFMSRIDYFRDWAFKTKKKLKILFLLFPKQCWHRKDKTPCSSEVPTVTDALRVCILEGHTAANRIPLGSVDPTWVCDHGENKVPSKRITALIKNLVKGPKGHLLTLRLCI